MVFRDNKLVHLVLIVKGCFFFVNRGKYNNNYNLLCILNEIWIGTKDVNHAIQHFNIYALAQIHKMANFFFLISHAPFDENAIESHTLTGKTIDIRNLQW